MLGMKAVEKEKGIAESFDPSPASEQSNAASIDPAIYVTCDHESWIKARIT